MDEFSKLVDEAERARDSGQTDLAHRKSTEAINLVNRRMGARENNWLSYHTFMKLGLEMAGLWEKTSPKETAGLEVRE